MNELKACIRQKLLETTIKNLEEDVADDVTAIRVTLWKAFRIIKTIECR